MERIFAKTILRAYSTLESMVNQIDDLIYRQALSTHSLRGNCLCTSAQRQVEQVIKLMNKKNNLINLKLIADEILSSLDRASNVVLTDKYINLLDAQQTISRLVISKRTYFRYLLSAEEKFAKKCIAMGYDYKWFEENYFDQRWIKEIFERIKNKIENKNSN